MAQPVIQGVVLEADESGSAGARPTKTSALGAMTLDVRNGFIRKVYALLTVMLGISTLVAVPFQLLSPEQVRANIGIIQGLMLMSLGVTLGMTCCCMHAMRRYPTNYVFIFVFALLYGVIIGTVTLAYTVASVLLAAGITAAMFIMLTAFACITKTDFTGIGPYLVCALFGLIAFGFVGILVSLFCASCYSWMQVLYAGIGATLFSMFIVYDTQLIVGGEHKRFEFAVDDFAFAALNLYLDIINLFFMILSLFGNRN